MIGRSQLLLFGIIIALASALTGVLVYHFTENSNQTIIITKTATPAVLQGVTRTYYIASDEVKWNYAPTGMNVITGKPLANDSGTALYTVEKNNGTQGTNLSSGNLKIGLSTNVANPITGQPTQLRVNFIDNQTNSIEEHVDYKVAIMKGTTQVFTTSLLHAADGSITIPYQFQDAGTYRVVVEVDGIWFMPVSEKAEFPINVASS